MSAKNKVVDRLLKIAKKHKFLTYPVLALVAIISVFNYFFSWSKGAGKRVVAVILVMVMMVSQSYFLTSSATALVDTEEAVETQLELQQEEADADSGDLVEDDNGGGSLVQGEAGGDTSVEVDESTEGSEEVSDTEEVDTEESGDETENEADVLEEDVNEDASTENTDEDKVTEDVTEESTEANNQETTEHPTKNKTDVELENTQANTIHCYLNADNGVALGELDFEQVSQGVCKASAEQQTTMAGFLTDSANTADGCYELIGWYYDQGCTNQVTNFSELTYNTTANSLTLYAKKNIIKYNISINYNGDESVTVDGVTGTDLVDKGAGVYQVSKTGTMDITGIYRNGYTVKSATINGEVVGTVSVDPATTKSSITGITFWGDDITRQVTIEWESLPYSIQYADEEEGKCSATYAMQELQYGVSANFYVPADYANERVGWILTGWQIGNTGVIVKDNYDVIDYQISLFPGNTSNDIVTLYPVYEYDAVKTEDKTIEYEYQKVSNEITKVQAHYDISGKHGGNNFTYAITSGENELKAIGINVAAVNEQGDANGISITTASTGPTKTTIDTGAITLTYTVTDKNAPAGTDPTEGTITVVVNQRAVALVAPSVGTNKTYDGDTSLSSKFPSEIPTTVNGVTASYTSGCYNSPNVAEANAIYLSGVTLNLSAEEAKNYVVTTEEVGEGHVCVIAGSISRRYLMLQTKAILPDGATYICAGEANPQFDVVEDTSNNSDSVGLVDESHWESIKESISYGTMPERSDLTQEGLYRVTAVAAATANYELVVTKYGEFNVVAEDVSSGDNYVIRGEIGNRDWYKSHPATIAPSGTKYNVVRVANNPNGTGYMEGSAVEITEEYYKENGSPVYVQLYSDPANGGTGAVTQWVRVELKVDETAPAYSGFELDYEGKIVYPSDQGLYFPSEGSYLTFGSYFNKVLHVNVTYQDETSKFEEARLYYGLFTNDSTQFSSVPFDYAKTTADGSATATFEVPIALLSGKIYIYAEDSAGNKSEMMVLSRDGAEDWSVEEEVPTIDSFKVTAGANSDKYAANDGNYYSNCVATVSATDKLSGINRIVWHVAVDGQVQDKEEIIGTDTATEKITNHTFNLPINNISFPTTSATYTVSATVYDNAGNGIGTTDAITFKVDDEKPTIHVTSNHDEWAKDAVVEFDFYDMISQVANVKVTDDEGTSINYSASDPSSVSKDGYTFNSYEATFNVDKKGTYYIIVEDHAGNVRTQELVMDKVSNVVPDCPGITITPDPNDGENNWYITRPEVAITNVTTATDNTPVYTKYQMWKEGETPYNITTLHGENEQFAITEDGIYHLTIWSESISGLMCGDEDGHNHEYLLQVDTVKPTIDYEINKGNNNSIAVSFTVADDGSGVNKDAVTVLHGSKPVAVKIAESEAGYTGSFEITEKGNYSIHAKDMAGNAADVEAFSPMSMKVKAVKNITTSSATIGANVIKGTFDISSAQISYRKLTDKKYTNTETITVLDEAGNMAVSAQLKNLEEGTSYAYKVVAVSAAGEVLEYVGYFKTLSYSIKGANVIGTARYFDNREGVITVGIYKGNECVGAVEIAAGSRFTFSNVPDGTYNVVATDGEYYRTTGVVVQDGVVVIPALGEVSLVLSGKNTSVEIETEDTPDVTVEDFDTIFDDTTNYTDEDKKMVENGEGTVEFKLVASLMRVSSVSAKEISAMYSVVDKNKVVGAYVDLSLYKIVTDNEGNVTTTRVKELGGGARLSVTIPLGDLQTKSGLIMVRIHQDGDMYTGAVLRDQDTNPATYTVTTSKFSTYALLHDKVEATTATTESDIVINNPPQKDNLTDELDDLDVEHNVPGLNTDTSTEDNTTNIPDEDTEEATTEEKEDSSVDTLVSPGTAKTGDEAPIAMAGILMLLALSGCIILRKRQND